MNLTVAFGARRLSAGVRRIQNARRGSRVVLLGRGARRGAARGQRQSARHALPRHERRGENAHQETESRVPIRSP